MTGMRASVESTISSRKEGSSLSTKPSTDTNANRTGKTEKNAYYAINAARLPASLAALPGHGDREASHRVPALPGVHRVHDARRREPRWLAISLRHSVFMSISLRAAGRPCIKPRSNLAAAPQLHRGPVV
jgi:hypothetical protein